MRVSCHVGVQNWGCSLSYRAMCIAQTVRKLTPSPRQKGPFLIQGYLAGPKWHLLLGAILSYCVSEQTLSALLFEMSASQSVTGPEHSQCTSVRAPRGKDTLKTFVLFRFFL